MSEFETFLLSFLWGQWREVGVPGFEKGFERVAVDPEWLVLMTGAVAKLDARLDDVAFSWCARNHEWISTRRLKALAETLDGGAGPAFEEWARALTPHLRTAWVDSAPRPGREVTREWAPDPHRPSLAVLRARALFGVGARADVLCELLGRSRVWTTAADLEGLGYTRRALANVLSNFEDGDLVLAKVQGRTKLYRLEHPAHVARLLGAFELDWPQWSSIGPVCMALLELERARPERPSFAVHLANVETTLASHAAQLRWEEPPPAEGRREPLFEWAMSRLAAVRQLTPKAQLIRALRDHFAGRGVVNVDTSFGGRAWDVLVQLEDPWKDVLVDVLEGPEPDTLEDTVRATLQGRASWERLTGRSARASVVVLSEPDTCGTLARTLESAVGRLPDGTVPLSLTAGVFTSAEVRDDPAGVAARLERLEGVRIPGMS